MVNASFESTVCYWRPPYLPGIEIIQEDNSIRLHKLYFNNYTISAALDVATEVHYRQQHYTITSGSVHFGEPGEVYTATRQYQPCSVRVLQIHPTAMQNTIDEFASAGTIHFRLPITWDADTYASLLRFHQSLRNNSSLLEQQTHLTETFRLLLTHYTEKRLRKTISHVGKAAVHRAREYLHAFWNTNVTLTDLANIAHQSKSHLIDSFRREFGMPPHTYQIYLRIAQARLLLAAGRPIAQVALEVGFADQAHLTRYFKRILGVTPATYARNQNIIQDNCPHAL